MNKQEFIKSNPIRLQKISLEEQTELKRDINKRDRMIIEIGRTWGALLTPMIEKYDSHSIVNIFDQIIVDIATLKDTEEAPTVNDLGMAIEILIGLKNSFVQSMIIGNEKGIQPITLKSITVL